jgi:hypothetical protein
MTRLNAVCCQKVYTDPNYHKIRKKENNPKIDPETRDQPDHEDEENLRFPREPKILPKSPVSLTDHLNELQNPRVIVSHVGSTNS